MHADPLIQAFFEEASELLADFEAGLLRLEETPADTELLNRIFRSAHTLKGNSAMLGFEDVAHFTHVLEDLLDQLRKGQRVVTPHVVDTLLASQDVVRVLLARVQVGSPTAPEERATADRVVEALRALLRGDPACATGPASEPTKPAATAERTLYEIRFRPPADVLRRGLDPMEIVRDVARLGEVLQVKLQADDLPPLGGLDPEQSYLSWQVWLMSGRPRAEVEACFDFVADPAAVRIDALEMDAAGGPAAGQSPAAGHAESSHPAAAQEARVTAAPPAVVEATSIRVAVEKVDRLINLVGELVISQSMVAQTVSGFTPDRLPALREAVAAMDRHARELHERMMAVRMVPIKTLFGRFPRLVRDLTMAVGKHAVLEVAGEETELDKTVIEKIGDPLTHLVRNAVDHGLESLEQRRAAGKLEAGTVRLEAYQQGGNIYIEVGDDGHGLDRDRIVRKAVQNGLIGPDQSLTDEEAWALIFRPGLSTAEKVTEVSGRGVGMDVVKRNVEALGGRITIHSSPGRGTTFKIKLPLTLAIVDGQSVRVGGETYIIPLVSIVESVRPRPDMMHLVLEGGEAITIRGQVLPVLRLHRQFDVPGAVEDPTHGLMVIVEHEGLKVAVLVDELFGQQQVVIKSLEHNFKKIDGVAGATILGDGRVALILDVPGLVAQARAGRQVRAQPEGRAQASVLVSAA